MTTHFTYSGALDKQGKKIRTLQEFSGVPAGTTGTVTGMYHRFSSKENNYGLDISWDLPDRLRPLVDGFSKDEYEEFLEEIT